MSDDVVIDVHKTATPPWVDAAGYRRMYKDSLADPLSFWREQGRRRGGRSRRNARGPCG